MIIPTRGCFDPSNEVRRIADFIKRKNIKIVNVLLTHDHIDHVGTAVDLAEELSVEILGPGQENESWRTRLEERAKMFGFGRVQLFTPTHWLT